MIFTTTVLLAGKTATGFVVPEEVVLSFGKGKRVPVTVTINGYTYRSTVAPHAGDYMLPLSAEHREAAGLTAGQEVAITLEYDAAPREVEIPADFARQLEMHPTAQEAFAKLAYSHRKEHVRAIEEAKTPETRQRRIEKAIEKLTA